MTIFVNYFINKKYQLFYVDTASQMANKYNVDIYVILATIKVESNGNVTALSNSGAQGLMQIMPSTAVFIANLNDIEYIYLYDIATNIEIGTAYLSYLQDRFEDDWVYVAYNAGETLTRKWINDGYMVDNIPYQETKDYVIRVNNALRVYRNMYYLQ